MENNKDPVKDKPGWFSYAKRVCINLVTISILLKPVVAVIRDILEMFK